MATEKVNKQTINHAAREIWLAGLGAFATAQAEGAKVFEGLVKEGEAMEKKTRKSVDSKVTEIRGRVEKQIDGVKTAATSNWDKLESVFEKRVAKALSGMGVPTREDVDNPSKEIAELSKAVKKLNDNTSKSAAKAA